MGKPKRRVGGAVLVESVEVKLEPRALPSQIAGSAPVNAVLAGLEGVGRCFHLAPASAVSRTGEQILPNKVVKGWI